MQKKTSFEIHAIETIMDYSMPHRSDSFTIIWFTAGCGKITIDLSERGFRPHTVYCLKPSQVFKWGKVPDMQGYILSFTCGFINSDKQDGNYQFMTNFFDILFKEGACELPEKIQQDMYQLAENMIREFTAINDGRGEMLRGLLKIFIIYLTRQMQPSAEPDQSSGTVSLTRRFFQLLENNYKTRKLVSDYAEALAVTPNHLSVIVKQTSGLSANHHIQQRIVLEAKRKAAYVDMNMKEIAYQLGFDDISHFSRFFKNVAGVNFTDYKKEMINRIGVS